MKLINALEIAKSCELDTIGEAILNIRLHVLNIFNFGEEQTEYEELCQDYMQYQQRYGYDMNTKIDDILNKN